MVFVLVVVVVDLMIVILFLVCRVAQKQLLDAILIIVTKRFYRELFLTLAPRIKELFCVGEKEKRKRREKNENEKRTVFEGKIRFQRDDGQISLLRLPDCCRRLSKGGVQTPHNTLEK